MANDDDRAPRSSPLDPATKIAQLRAELDRVRALAERFRQLIEAAPDAIVVVDEAARIVLANAQAEKLFGYRARDLLGKPIEILVPEAARARHVAHRDGFMGLPAVRPMGTALDLAARRRDGTSVPVEISLSPLRTRDGLLVSAAIRDITGRRRAQDALREADGAFDAHARQPAADLRRSLPPGPRERWLVPVPVDVGELTTRFAERLRHTLGDAIAVRTLASAGLPRAQVDPLQLEKALLELAIDARAAMPAGGCLTMEATPAPPGAGPAGSDPPEPPGSYVMIAVQDTGAGTPTADAARAFEPDHAADAPGPDRPGLALVGAFATQSGGWSAIDSIPGAGTTVRLYLPAVPGPG